MEKLKKCNLFKIITIIVLSVLLVFSTAFNIFILTIFEIKDVESFKQVLLCRELLDSLSQPKDTTNPDTDIPESSADSSEASPELPATARVVFAEDNITVTYIKQESGLVGPTLKFLIENNSNKTIDINFTNVYIDGYITSLSGGYCDSLAAGKKAYTDLTLWEADFEDFVDFPTEIEFIIKLVDPASFDTIKQSNLIHITLSK